MEIFKNRRSCPPGDRNEIRIMPEKTQNPQDKDIPSGSIDWEMSDKNTLILTMKGRFDSDTTGRAWRETMNILGQTAPSKIAVDASGVEYCDVSGIGLLWEIRRQQEQKSGGFVLTGLRPEFQQVLDFFEVSEFEETPDEKPIAHNVIEDIGRTAFNVWEDARALIVFVGEACTSLFDVLKNPKMVRWKDIFTVAESAGLNALPIVGLITFLIGLIMAFQSAIPMRQFGAEIYVANLIGLSMVRELGPLMTAITLTGRSGSAFAAELGTMKINEEIDALTTMGLNPMGFLVVPRLLAAFIMTPLITVFADLIGIIGGSIVLITMGYPIATYINQVQQSVNYIDFLGGLFKSFVFGILVAGIGCLQGLKTTTGAAAVGEATTSAVVRGIIIVVVVDGIFSVLFYYLGI